MDRSTEDAPLHAQNPYEFRKDLSVEMPEVDVRAALRSGDVGFVHSFTTGSTVDGPGVRVVVWTTACMFRCAFCHNPDTWTLTNGVPVSVSDAVDELRKYQFGLRAMKGGFTLSGGEPLMQHRFAAKMFAEAKAMGLHTAIETNGFYGYRLSDAEIADIDLVILDMKALRPERHVRVCGAPDNASVLEFARRLADLRRPMWLRYVLVPGLTDDDEEMELLAQFGASLGVVEKAEILPFHQLGRYKWKRLGLDYTLADLEPPTQESIDRATGIFAAAGLAAC